MRALHVVFVLFILATVGCAHQVSFVPTDSEFLYHIDLVSVRELNSNPEKYHGQTVYVMGYLLLFPPSHNLYNSKEEREIAHQAQKNDNPFLAHFDFDNYRRNCFAIANPYGLLRQISRLDGATVIIKGEYISDFYLLEPMIDFGSCSITSGPALVVDYDDFKRRYPTVFSDGCRRC